MLTSGAAMKMIGYECARCSEVPMIFILTQRNDEARRKTEMQGQAPEKGGAKVTNCKPCVTIMQDTTPMSRFSNHIPLSKL
jgi:hypothetical protein